VAVPIWLPIVESPTPTYPGTYRLVACLSTTDPDSEMYRLYLDKLPSDASGLPQNENAELRRQISRKILQETEEFLAQFVGLRYDRHNP
jgi:hypothetical protein